MRGGWTAYRVREIYACKPIPPPRRRRLGVSAYTQLFTLAESPCTCTRPQEKREKASVLFRGRGRGRERPRRPRNIFPSLRTSSSAERKKRRRRNIKEFTPRLSRFGKRNPSLRASFTCMESRGYAHSDPRSLENSSFLGLNEAGFDDCQRRFFQLSK